MKRTRFSEYKTSPPANLSASRPSSQSIHTQHDCLSLILEVCNVEQTRHCESH
jgi:hypothetical protein